MVMTRGMDPYGYAYVGPVYTVVCDLFIYAKVESALLYDILSSLRYIQ